MLAPLPRLYRFGLTALVVALGIAAGLFAAQAWSLSLPLGGLLMGSLAGLGVGYLFVHDFHRSPARPRPVRVDRL